MTMGKKDAEYPRNEDNEALSTEEPRVNQYKENNVNNTNNINTISLTANAAGIEDNTVDKKIVYGCADDPNMPNLEEIVYSDDDEDVGTEADITNLETNIPISLILTTRIHKDQPVEQIIRDIHSAPQTRRMTKCVTNHGARIEAIRLFLACALFKDFIVYQLDVKSAFLYGNIKEEVYVCQPPGFEDPEFHDRVYNVETHYMVYIKLIELGMRLYLPINWTTDFKEEMCTEFEKIMHKKFQISSMGELTFFLGLHVTQKNDRIFISQDKYVNEISKKFGFSTVKTTSTPMETSKPLMKDENTGSLMYLTSLRPDIMFAVCAYARFKVTPKVSHLYAVKRIFRYLKDQPKLGLWYPNELPFNLEAYTDSDYAGASLHKKSTT
uniref:Reverse transcriptase Ty1/copia-type domain-containing protein n=1 Tax=Tanacetum cinerariifolium TaxID=118510 RepID=A0A6L2KG65_TANCI|nr:hypothetical protein [Tanacetum cinerariifolium]